MSTRTETPASSPRGPMLVMVAGGVLVAALVGWALTRSVEPAPPAPSDTIATTPPPAVPSTVPTTTTAPLSPGAFSIPAGGQQQDPDKAVVARMSAEDLHAKFTRGDVTILDVRDANAYATGHIPGSLNIPMSSVQTQIDTLPKGKTIVAYCT